MEFFCVCNVSYKLLLAKSGRVFSFLRFLRASRRAGSNGRTTVFTRELSEDSRASSVKGLCVVWCGVVGGCVCVCVCVVCVFEMAITSKLC
jgi:hypothetical protein